MCEKKSADDPLRHRLAHPEGRRAELSTGATVSTPMLLNVLRSGKIDPKLLITHRFKLDRILDAYETFAHAASTRAIKVLIDAQ